MVTSLFLLPALFFILIGGLLLFFGIRNKKKRIKLTKDGNRAKGIIIDNDETLIGEKYYYFSIVEVNDSIEGKIRLRMKLGTPAPRVVGNEIEIVYDSNKKNDVFEYTNSISWSNTVFYLIGIMFIIIGAIWSSVIITLSYFINNLE